MNNTFPEVPVQQIKEETLKETVNTLNLVNYQIAELIKIKEELEARVNALIDHPDDGSKTYSVDKFKITITSGYNYSLNKEEYELIKSRLPECFNPVKERIAYDIDKKIIRDAEKYASTEELVMLAEVITKKPKKLHLRVTANV